MQQRARVALSSDARGARCRLSRHPLACSWRSLSTCNASVARSLILASAQHELQHLAFIARVRISLFLLCGSLSRSPRLSRRSLSRPPRLSLVHRVSLSLVRRVSLSFTASLAFSSLASASARTSLGFIGAVDRSRPRPATGHVDWTRLDSTRLDSRAGAYIRRTSTLLLS